jgi:hypothetical protein
MSGIDFVIDRRGNKKAVVIDLKKHAQLWEDVYDSFLLKARRSEPRESLDAVKQRLK